MSESDTDSVDALIEAYGCLVVAEMYLQEVGEDKLVERLTEMQMDVREKVHEYR